MQLAFSQSCENNKQPILEVLSTAFAKSTHILEIGSGTGQHAVHFAREMPHLFWQTSDQQPYLEQISQRLLQYPTANIGQPVALDVSQAWPIKNSHFDGIFTANSVHIMDKIMVEDLFSGIGSFLSPFGSLCIYGPFNYNGQFTSESNARFEQWLKQRNPHSGIKDFEWIVELAFNQGLKLQSDHSLPANNRLLHFKRE